MTRDPLTTWDGPFPYDALAGFGITPRSTHADVLEKGFDVLGRNPTPEIRAAWDTLRRIPRRMVADFLLYPCELAEETAELLAAVDRALADPEKVADAGKLLTRELNTLAGLLDEPCELGLDMPRPPMPPEFEEPPYPPVTDLIEFDR